MAGKKGEKEGKREGKRMNRRGCVCVYETITSLQTVCTHKYPSSISPEH